MESVKIRSKIICFSDVVSTGILSDTNKSASNQCWMIIYTAQSALIWTASWGPKFWNTFFSIGCPKTVLNGICAVTLVEEDPSALGLLFAGSLLCSTLFGIWHFCTLIVMLNNCLFCSARGNRLQCFISGVFLLF